MSQIANIVRRRGGGEGPSSLEVIDISNTSVELNWNGEGTIQRDTNSGFSSPTEVYSGEGPFENTGLTADTTYYYRLVGANDVSVKTFTTAFQTNIINYAAGQGYVIPPIASLSLLDVFYKNRVADGSLTKANRMHVTMLGVQGCEPWRKINWASPGTNNLVTTKLDSNLGGFKGNAVDGFANTNFNISTETNKATLGNCCRAIFVTTAPSAGFGPLDGVVANARNGMLSGNTTLQKLNIGTATSPSNIDLSGTGLKALTRNNTGTFWWKNNGSSGELTRGTTTETFVQCILVSNNVYSNAEFGFYIISQYLSVAELEAIRLELVALHAAFGASVGKTYYISKTGNDSNDGVTVDTPILTIAKFVEAVVLFGRRLVFLDDEDAVYREFLNISSNSQAVSVDGNFNDINACDVITGWTQPDAVTYPNVWSKSITHQNTSVNERLMVMQDTIPMNHVASIALCNSTPNSRYYADYGNVNPVTVYIHATGSGNPNTNGRVYEASVRSACIRNSNNLTCENIVLRNGADNYGSIDPGLNFTGKKILLTNGTRHHAVFGSGLLEDCIGFGFDTDTVGGGIGFTAYTTNASGLSAICRRCFVVPRAYTVGYSAFYAHSSGGNKHQNITFEQCYAKDVSYFFQAECVNHTLRNCIAINSQEVGTDAMIGQVEGTTIIERVLTKYISKFILTSSQGSPTIVASTVTNCFAYSTVSGSVLGVGSKVGPMTFEKNVWIKLVSSNILDVPPAGSVVTNNKNIFQYTDNVNGRPIKIPVGTTYIGNYNIFLSSGGVTIRMDYNGVTYTTLSAWQSATGQDTQSVYLTVAQQANFWLGNPADGDLRINPNAQVTAGNGTIYTGTFPDGTPITEAGIQEYWDFNQREVVEGQPTSWPVFPDTEAESLAYIKNPEGWSF